MFLCKDFYVYFVLISFSNAVLNTKPKNTVSHEGKRVELECGSDSQNPIDWSFTPAGSTAQTQFYFNWAFYFFFESLYAIKRDETGQCNLIINSVNFSYAGSYKCTTKTSANEKESHSAELVVLEPIRIGKEINASHVILDCSVNFRGNWAPELEWSHSGTLVVEGVDASVVPNQKVSNFLVVSRNDTASAGNYTCTTRFDLKGKPNQTTGTSVPSYVEKSILTIDMEDLHLGDSAEEERKAEEVQLPDPPDAPSSDVQATASKLQLNAIVSAANPNLSQSAPNAVEDGEEHTSDDIRNSSSSNANETAYEKPAKMEGLGPDEQQKMYENLHIYANTILATDYEN